MNSFIFCDTEITLPYWFLRYHGLIPVNQQVSKEQFCAVRLWCQVSKIYTKCLSSLQFFYSRNWVASRAESLQLCNSSTHHLLPWTFSRCDRIRCVCCLRYSCPYIYNLSIHGKRVLSLILGSKYKVLYLINDIQKQNYLHVHQYVMHEWIQCKCIRLKPDIQSKFTFYWQTS